MKIQGICRLWVSIEFKVIYYCKNITDMNHNMHRAESMYKIRIMSSAYNRQTTTKLFK